ncbi:DUF1540 domain-containing protein [Pseudalkalibacillus caeni]|uniref:DUF1540 domain-containing protein n=1 Tax=Exobacillus caeni TaxID=2574798 RepID=A0A5R9F0T1_9BACL|nr:DUF1540 domain-containing protein [Pseudalkalibacillus caeni]TLS36289.1 DUF1540 domain-containing protein [Pseudalkalibacillus caeni]
MPTVKCNVSNCNYWAEGNNCSADAILVEIDSHAEHPYKIQGGELEGEAKHKDEADKTAETCCHTFELKH